MSSPLLNTAKRAAANAGKIISRFIEYPDELEVHQKSPTDFVTNADLSAEDAIVDTLRQANPDFGILSEEHGLIGPENSEWTWVVDPLDGTTNFLHGFPQFAVSIGLKHKNQIVEAVVYDIVKEEMFTATRGEGAFLNNHRIRVTPRREINEALVGIGFPFRQTDNTEAYLRVFRAMAGKVAGLRRTGSAALDLCYVASGRLDAYWEPSLKPWDLAAGSLIVLEAGGLVTDFDGNENYFESGNLVAATPRIFPYVLNAVKRHYVSHP